LYINLAWTGTAIGFCASREHQLKFLILFILTCIRLGLLSPGSAKADVGEVKTETLV